MIYPAEFDDIRRLYDSEVKPVLSEIVSQPQVRAIVQYVLGEDYTDYFFDKLSKVSTIEEFQREVIGMIITTIEHKTCKSVNLYGTENVDLQKGNLFVSNHRDIVLDSAFLNSHLLFKGYKTTQIGIGNNLLAQPWITYSVRLNKSFVVKRDGTIKEQFLISKQLSEYIRMIREAGESVWIAQREGRAKNSDDRTQPSIIKMFGMSGGTDLASSVEELNITPVSINYEYDPCDWLKAREFQLKRDNPEYKKSQQEDILNMKTGLMGYKGRVTFVIGKPIRQMKQMCGDTPKNEQARIIASGLDKEIHKGYKLFPINYVAADLLEGGNRFSSLYTSADATSFESYINSRIALIDIPNPDYDFLRGKFIEMYGFPAVNKAAAE